MLGDVRKLKHKTKMRQWENKTSVMIFHVRTCNGQSIPHHEMEQNEYGVGSLLALMMQYYFASCYFIIFYPSNLFGHLAWDF